MVPEHRRLAGQDLVGVVGVKALFVRLPVFANHHGEDAAFAFGMRVGCECSGPGNIAMAGEIQF